MADEISLLCTHGILHLLGFDHAEPDEHARMFALQDKLLGSWDRPAPAAGAARGAGPEAGSPASADSDAADSEGSDSMPRTLRARTAGRAETLRAWTLKPGTRRPGALKPGTRRPGALKPGDAGGPRTLKPGTWRPGDPRPGDVSRGTLPRAARHDPGHADQGEAPVGWLLVAALALVLLAGWCASAETALLRVSRAGAKELGRSPGEGGAAPLQAVLSEISRYLSVLALVRVAGEIAATVLVTAVFVVEVGRDWRAFLSAAVVMIIVLLRHRRDHPAPRRPGRAPSRSRSRPPPCSARWSGCSARCPRLLRATGSALSPGSEGRDDPSGSEEELRGLVDLLEQRQIIQPDERDMIHSVFELGDTIVREVMVPRTDMVFVEHDKTLRQALSLALRSGFSRIPVVGENLDDVTGIAYLKDLVTRTHEHPEGESVEAVGSVMRPATFVPESKPIDELLREMQARQIHMAIVIDEYGGTAGLVTIEDILEEIVGEIADEYDREQPPVEWLGVTTRPGSPPGCRSRS